MALTQAHADVIYADKNGFQVWCQHLVSVNNLGHLAKGERACALLNARAVRLSNAERIRLKRFSQAMYQNREAMRSRSIAELLS